MIIEAILAGLYEENCYILMDEETKEAAILDPGGSPSSIKSRVLSLGANVKYILLTHAHFDHVGAVQDIKEAFNSPLYVSEIDAIYSKEDTSVYGPIGEGNKYLNDGDILKLGNKEIKVIETPGHTKGGLCFLVEDILVTGDTLFRGSIGRSDFIGGDFKELITSIKTKLLPLGDNVKVYPGHGPSSTIGYEKDMNPFLD